ncbi:MAG TPA: triose-phosphate isomerase [Thermoanaerobaculia bacterium]|nr:triose-phosphate isomerase [Thermoanaerobaculia bacterium]
MKLFVANWKMHKTRAAARAFAEELGRTIGDGIAGAELVVAPAYPLLDAARDDRGRWRLGCQNVASEAEGAFTGEVSAAMAADAGCAYAIVGHSERRRLFGEDGPVLAKKVARCREARLVPIFCVGETEEERDAGLTATTLVRQLDALRSDASAQPLVVAYEPVWAIGSGRTATPEDCGSALVHIAEILSDRRDLRLLYGGSVTPENCRPLLGAPRTDGFLIGGSSLSAPAFATIARA